VAGFAALSNEAHHGSTIIIFTIIGEIAMMIIKKSGQKNMMDIG